MNIYVANLSWNTNSDSLQELFSQYGEVTSAYIINDRETGRWRRQSWWWLWRRPRWKILILQLNNK